MYSLMNFDKICILFHVTIYCSKDTEYFHHLKKSPQAPFIVNHLPLPQDLSNQRYIFCPHSFFWSILGRKYFYYETKHGLIIHCRDATWCRGYENGSVTMILPSIECLINTITQYVVFYVYFFSLSIMLLKGRPCPCMCHSSIIFIVISIQLNGYKILLIKFVLCYLSSLKRTSLPVDICQTLYARPVMGPGGKKINWHIVLILLEFLCKQMILIQYCWAKMKYVLEL